MKLVKQHIQFFFLKFLFPLRSTLQSVMEILVKAMSITRFLLCEWLLTQDWRELRSDIKVQFKHLIRERWLMATNLKSHLQTKTQARAWDDLCHMATNKAISPEVGQIYQYCWLNWLRVFCQTPKHVSMFLSSREN